MMTRTTTSPIRWLILTLFAVVVGIASALAGAAVNVVAAPDTIPTPIPHPQRTTVPAGATFPVPLPPKTLPPALAQPVPTPVFDTATVRAWYAAGQALRPDADPRGNDVVATVGSRDVQRREITYAQVLARGTGGTVRDARAILEGKKRGVAIDAEAAKRGLLPTASELDAYINDLRKKLHRDPQGATEFAAFLSGLRLSEDEYFAGAEARDDYARQFAAARLREQVVGQLGADQRDAAWAAFVSSKASDVTVVIHDAALP